MSDASSTSPPSTRKRKRDSDDSAPIPTTAEEDPPGDEETKDLKSIEDNDDEGSDTGGEASSCTSLTLESGPKFHVNERVLVTDTQQMGGAKSTGNSDLPSLYEAIIRKSGLKIVDPTTRKIMPERKKRGGRGRRRGHHHHHHHDGTIENDGGIKEWCHLIHFQGWNARHDKWMTESDVFHDTPENRKRVGASVGKVARAAPKPKDEEKKKKGKKGKKRGRGEDGGVDDGAYEDGGVYQKNLRLISKACTLPFTLQTILVDDRDKITKRVYPPLSFGSNDNVNWLERRKRGIKMLHVLPAATNIIDILGQYVREKKQEDLEEFAREQEERRQQKREEEEKLKQQQQSSWKNKDVADDDKEEGGKSASEAKDDEPTDKDIKQQQQQSSQATTPNSTISPKAMLKLKKKKRKQFALNIIALVDISLPLFLLYTEEHEQFARYVEEHNKIVKSASDAGDDSDEEDSGGSKEQKVSIQRPSERYGAEHLLRFFVKLPFILSQHDPSKKKKKRAKENNVDSDNDGGNSANNDADDNGGGDPYLLASEEQSREFATHLSELIIFMQKNLDCFKSKYYAVK